MGLWTLISTSLRASNFQSRRKYCLTLSTCSRSRKSQWTGLGIWSTCSTVPFLTSWSRTRISSPVMRRMCSWIINTARTCRRKLRIRVTCSCLQTNTMSPSFTTRRSSTKTKTDSRASTIISLQMCNSSAVSWMRQIKMCRFPLKYNSKTSILMTERNVWRSSAFIPKMQRLASIRKTTSQQMRQSLMQSRCCLKIMNLRRPRSWEKGGRLNLRREKSLMQRKILKWARTYLKV